MGDSPTEAIKERIDIVALISESLSLKRAGSNLKAKCPFHEEDTPSFMVSPTRQMFHCFGCGETGDVFSWLMKREGMSFPEALRVLAQRAGVQLTFERPEQRDERERLRSTLDLVVGFYQRVLTEASAGKEALDYLESRGITNESIQNWRVGYCPLISTGIEKKARDRGVANEYLVRTGVIRNSGERIYEFFYGRILFPLFDAHGSVVGLAGRVFGESKTDTAKYINSPETDLYTKSKVLYGLNRAKDSIRKENLAVLVEGYTDVIASHQAGVTTAVATAGTALTEDHLLLLRRFTDHIAFAFDADTAGATATRRAIDMAIANDFFVSVVVLPEGRDPADLAIENPQLWREALENREDAFPFLLKRASEVHSLDTPESKKEIASDLLPLIARIKNQVVAGKYVQELALVLQIDSRFVYDDLKRIVKENEVYQKNEPSRVKEGVGKISKFSSYQTDVQIRREERLLSILVAEPSLIPKVEEIISEDVLTTSHTKALYTKLKTWYPREHAQEEGSNSSTIDDLQSQLSEDLQKRFSALRFSSEAESERDDWQPLQEAGVLVREILGAHWRKELHSQTERLRNSDESDRQQLLKDVAQVTSELAQVDNVTLS